jgi:hypothetical protein
MSREDHVDNRRRFKALLSRTDGAAAACLVVAFTFVYLSTAKGVLEYGDDWSMLYVTSALVDHLGADVPADSPGAVPGIDRRFYSKYGIGQSLTAVPFYLAGRELAGIRGHQIAANGQLLQATELTFAVTTVSVLATATTVGLLFLTCRALGFSTRASFVTAAALGIGTFAWHYSRTFMTEPSSMLALLASTYLLLRWRLRPRPLTLALSGIAAGVTILLHLSTVVALPALGVWLLWTSWNERRGLTRTLVAAAIWGSPIVVAILVVATYNALRFGHIGETGYGSPTAALVHPVWVGLYGFLLSPGKSVFVYAPILLASAAGWGRLWRRDPTVATVVTVSIVCYLTFHAGLSYWWGGGAWGPRYAAILLPLMLLGLPALIDGGLGKWGWAALMALGVASVFVQCASVFVPYIPYEARMEATPALFDEMLWNPAFSPVVYHSVSLLRHEYALDVAFKYYQKPEWIWLQSAASVIAIGLVVGCAWRTCGRSARIAHDAD